MTSRTTFSLLSIAMIYLLILGVQPSQSEVEGLVGKWLFDENKGDTAKDPISKLDGTLKGDPKWVKGQIGSALEFNKSNWVEVADHALLDITDELTAMAWVNPTEEKQNEFAKILAKRKDPQYPYQIAYQTDGGATFVAGISVKGANIHSVPSIPGFTGWRHLAMVFDGQKLKLYMDAKEVATADAKGKLDTNNQPFYIGGRGDSPTQRFAGVVDEVRLFNRELLPAEIKSLMEKGDAAAVAPGDKLPVVWGKLKTL